MTFAPATREIALDGEPDVTGEPLTVTLAFVSESVGVTVMLVTPFATVAEYEVVLVEKAGVSVPLLKLRLLRLASPLRLERVTVTV